MPSFSPTGMLVFMQNNTEYVKPDKPSTPLMSAVVWDRCLQDFNNKALKFMALMSQSLISKGINLPKASLYDGKHLPFEDNFFDSAGAFNARTLKNRRISFFELVRVVKPSGKSCPLQPNFFRVIGFQRLSS